MAVNNNTSKNQELIKGCINGNPTAQKTLYDMFAAQMLSVCFRYINNQDDAEDAFQEGFCQVFRNLEQLRNCNALSGWIKRIFVNSALQHNNKNNLFLSLDKREYTDENFIEANSILSALETEELTKLIQELPIGCQKVFNLYVIDGYSHKEIAKMLEITVGTSKSQLHEARQKLKLEIIKNSLETCKQIG